MVAEVNLKENPDYEYSFLQFLNLIAVKKIQTFKFFRQKKIVKRLLITKTTLRR